MLVPRNPKYKLIEPENGVPDENWWIEITKGKFAGTKFSFDKLTPTEECLKYSFTIQETDHIDLSEKNKQFRKIVENILVDILKEKMHVGSEESFRDGTVNTE